MNSCVKYLTVTAALLLSTSTILAQDNGDKDEDTFAFQAELSGAQEVVPPNAPATPSLGVETKTTGQVQVNFAADLSAFDFQLLVQNGEQVTQAHLHCGRAGQNGPVVVFLAPLNEQGADVNGLLAKGTRRNRDIEAGAQACEELIGRPVRNIASLAAAAFEGLVYANVHTVDNPAGEVRGQLVPTSDTDLENGEE